MATIPLYWIKNKRATSSEAALLIQLKPGLLVTACSEGSEEQEQVSRVHNAI